jgi:hypothetical protein
MHPFSSGGAGSARAQRRPCWGTPTAPAQRPSASVVPRQLTAPWPTAAGGFAQRCRVPAPRARWPARARGRLVLSRGGGLGDHPQPCCSGRNGAVRLTRPWSRLVRQRVVQIRRNGRGARKCRNAKAQRRSTGPRMQMSRLSAAAGLRKLGSGRWRCERSHGLCEPGMSATRRSEPARPRGTGPMTTLFLAGRLLWSDFASTKESTSLTVVGVGLLSRAPSLRRVRGAARRGRSAARSAS